MTEPANTAICLPETREQSAAAWWREAGVCLLLAVIVGLVFGQTLHHDFVNYDDDLYVYENQHVADGLSFEGVGWAFTTGHGDNWHPLTWLSHMLDGQLYGLKAGGHHFTSVCLHAATAILLFLVLRRMTGALWPSAFVAAVFAVHPLRAESVAWVAERTDVLSGLFFMLTLLAYVRYIRSPFSLGRYLLVLLLYALGLMSKPMLVTLPFVLLLLDYWPLARLRPQAAGSGEPPAKSPASLLFEKIPFLVLAIISSVITLVVQQRAVANLEWLPWTARVGNAIVSYAVYAGQTVWPVGLAVFYPHPTGRVGVLNFALALAFLAGVCAVAFALRRRCPYWVVGWLWYLGMLVPVIGLVQVGEQARADRYTYLPQIGLYIMLTWTANALPWPARQRRWLLAGAGSIALVALAWSSWLQTAHWRNSESLWTRALARTTGNYVAHNNLGNALAEQGRAVEAATHFRRALEIKPDFAEAHNNLGTVLLEQGRNTEATQQFQKALSIRPGYAEAHYNLGNALAQQGQPAEAIGHFREALRTRPDSFKAHYGLGAALAVLRQHAEATLHFQRALQLKPGAADIHFNFGVVLAAQDRSAEAIQHFQRALEIQPENAEAHYRLGLTFQARRQFAAAIQQYEMAAALAPGHASARNNLAWLLATCPESALRDGRRAVELAQTLTLSQNDTRPHVLDTLAAGYAEMGQFKQAVELARRALALANALSNEDIASAIRSRLQLYEANTPFRETP